MATFLTYTKTPFIPILIFFLFSPFSTLFTRAHFSENILERDNNHDRLIKLKTSHLHFYFHDIVSGKHPTVIMVAGEKNKFGMTRIIDDPLTEGANPESKLVGRAQGMYMSSSQDSSSLQMAMTLEFVVGKYNGSTLTILGRNPFLETVREMPVVGGTRLFRFARGYALAKTVQFNPATGDAVVEYNVFVIHY